MEEPSGQGNASRWATVASGVAPVVAALCLAALVVIPVVAQNRAAHRLKEVNELAEPARYVLDVIAVTTGVQSRAARGALAFPEQRGEYAVLHEDASRSQDSALEELLQLTGRLDPEAHASAERLHDALARWHERQRQFFTGALSVEELRRAVPAQDALFDDAVDEWSRCSRILRRLSEERRKGLLEAERAQAFITSGLALVALLTLLVVLFLAHRGRALEAAVSRRLVAERASAARAEVLAQVSHDLRSPLTAILTSCSTIHRTPVGDDPLAKRALERIESASRRMNRLVGDLLDQARLSAGLGLGMNAYDIDVVPIVLRCREEASPDRPARVRCHIDEQARRVIADPDRLEQVLVNLLNNALKFSPPGASVRIDVTAEGEHAVFRVHDDGPGVSEEERPFLFVPFWQSTRDRRPGYGLGLPIARAIVEAHGGRIWLDDSHGERGSTFAFTLPRA